MPEITITPLLSVIIANYNYERFIGDAIHSALNIDWPRIEVIVVDDGSTDQSRSIIQSYDSSKVNAIFQKNSGPAIAHDAGFSISNGDLILFLDADDIVEARIMKRLMGHWADGVSKFQFQMLAVDENGTPIGSVFPRIAGSISSSSIQKWYAKSSSYPTPPGSGNIYTRSFLSKIFPIERGMDRASDSYCLSTAPLLGDVVVIAEPLIRYRIHQNNLAAMTSIKPEKFGIELQRALKRNDYAIRIAAKYGTRIRPGNAFRSIKNQQLRATSFVLSRARHPIEHDSRWKILFDTILAAITPQGNSLFAQVANTTWIALLLISPPCVANALIAWRYVPNARPDWIRTMVRRI